MQKSEESGRLKWFVFILILIFFVFSRWLVVPTAGSMVLVDIAGREIFKIYLVPLSWGIDKFLGVESGGEGGFSKLRSGKPTQLIFWIR